MKRIGAIVAGSLVGSLLSLNLVIAQTPLPASPSTFSSHPTVDSQLTKSIPTGHDQPAPNGQFIPRPTGAIYDVYMHGWNAISPVAPKEQGYGEKNLTAFPPASQPPNGASSPQKAPDFGGIKLFGFDF